MYFNAGKVALKIHVEVDGIYLKGKRMKFNKKNFNLFILALMVYGFLSSSAIASIDTREEKITIADQSNQTIVAQVLPNEFSLAPSAKTECIRAFSMQTAHIWSLHYSRTTDSPIIITKTDKTPICIVKTLVSSDDIQLDVDHPEKCMVTLAGEDQQTVKMYIVVV